MAEYVRVTPRDGETFEELNERLNLDFFRGSGYYKLTRSEKISANKDMVMSLDDKTRWIAGPTDVREELGVGKGAITVKPIDIPDGCELFVQSTSWNRKLRDGHDVLFRKSTGTDGGVTITLHASVGPEPSVSPTRAKASPKKAKAKKRKANDDGDDDDDDDNDNDSSNRKSPRTRRATRRGATDADNDDDDDDDDDDDGGDPGPDEAPSDDTDDIVVWSKLLFDLKEEVEALDGESLVVGSTESGVPGDCDLPVPNVFIEEAVAQVVEGAIRSVTSWNKVEETVVQPNRTNRFAPNDPLRRYQWRSNKNGGSRLLYVDSPNANFIALELRDRNFGLVCGNCGAHPFVQCPRFMYSNSDGSSQDTPLQGGLITPEIVLAKLIHDMAMHCQNNGH